MREEIKLRTKKIGIEVINLIDELPDKTSAALIAEQIVRSATSIGANFRAACRAKSEADFMYKLKIVEEETDQTMYWLELMEEANLISKGKIDGIKRETHHILSIIGSSIKTSRYRI